MPALTKQDVRDIVQEETSGLKDHVAKLQGDTATLKVDVGEIKTDVRELKENMQVLLTSVDGFMKRLEHEEEERTSADSLLDRRIETLEQKTRA